MLRRFSALSALRIVHVIAITFVLCTWSEAASAQCPQPNGNDQEPDTEAIQCLLDQGETITLDADTLYAYFIAPHPVTGQGLVLRRSNTILTSTSAWGYRALLRATPNLNVPMLQVESSAVSNYRIEKIWFYGARWDRTNPNCGDDQSVNLWLSGSGWTVDDVESDTAPCNTSTVVDGGSSDFTISNSWFAFNGWGEDELPGGSCSSTRCWADGLTVHACVRGWIHHNHFRDNTDVDLVVGGGPNCTVEFNDIVHNGSGYGFAGIHVGWFPNDNPDIGNGNHAGNVYRWNTVSSVPNKLAFGIIVGSHPWTTEYPTRVTNAGSVVDNPTISGAVINLAIEASFSSIPGQVTGNNPSGAQGNRGFKGCTESHNYTVYQPHAQGVTKQEGWFELQFDNNVCTPR